jgi:hypothetical protein
MTNRNNITSVRACSSWILTICAVLLSPIFVIFLIPLTIGVGIDIFDLIGEVPFAISLFASAALVLFRLVLSRTPGSSAPGGALRRQVTH